MLFTPEYCSLPNRHIVPLKHQSIRTCEYSDPDSPEQHYETESPRDSFWDRWAFMHQVHAHTKHMIRVIRGQLNWSVVRSSEMITQLNPLQSASWQHKVTAQRHENGYNLVLAKRYSWCMCTSTAGLVMGCLHTLEYCRGRWHTCETGWNQT